MPFPVVGRASIVPGHDARRAAMNRRRRQAGVALLLVLSVLVLISALIIGLLVSARQEVVTSSAYNAGSESRLLADMPVSLVTAQIAQATADKDKAWISQPGLIRTFGSGGQEKYFKLYSSYTMADEKKDYNPGDQATLNTEVPLDWHKRPLEFVDLNRPVQSYNAADPTSPRFVYPIADPAAKATVQGFDFDAASRVASGGTAAGANTLPMPVRWIYVLADGKLVGASDSARPDAVSRIAYWTDDETSKVNINTAAGGIYYDEPAVNTTEDHMFGRTQPIAQEYQRWPGHPSTTSLSPVIKALRDIGDSKARSEQAALLTPRIAWGGSKGGSKYAWFNFTGDPAVLVNLDSDRLFTSTDELIYGLKPVADPLAPSTLKADRIPFVLSGGTSLEAGGQKIDQLRFFLTAQSHAPELNLFNRPRVSMWPFNRDLVVNATSGANTLTPEDRLIRVASELGGVDASGNFDYAGMKRKRFYFQRESAWDPLWDYQQLPENRALFSYLRAMTEKAPPTATSARADGSTLEFKYRDGGNRDQILVEMWDYIRSQINTVNMAYQPANFTKYSFPKDHNTQQAGFNDIAPLMISGVGKGFGRFPSLTEVALQFIDAGERIERIPDTDAGTPVDTIDNETGAPPKDDSPDYVIRKVRLVVLLGFHRPVMHLLDSMPRFQIEITANPLAPTPFNIDTTRDPLGMPLNTTLPNPIQVRNPMAGTAWLTALGAGGMGFPNLPGPDYRTRCYVNAFQMSGIPTGGGTLGLGYAMYAPIDPGISTGNTGNPHASHNLKILSNRTASSSLNGEDALQLPRFTGGSGREDIYYPFVSDIIEFRLPQQFTKATIPLPVAVNGKKIDGNPSHKSGYDFFNVTLKGATMVINMYPGLKDTATALSPGTNWQTPIPLTPATLNTSNSLWKTVITFADTVIPLPRLGPSNLKPNSAGPVYSAFSNYYMREVESPSMNLNYIANVPAPANSSEVVNQMDVFRSYDLTGTTPLFGDLRISAVAREVPTNWWQPYPRKEPGSFQGMGFLPPQMKAATASNDSAESYNLMPDGASNNQPYAAAGRIGRFHAGVNSYTGDTGTKRTVSPLATASTRDGSLSVGDFTLGYGDSFFGALVNGPDIGTVSFESNVESDPGSSGPYYSGSISREGANDTTVLTNPYFTNYTGIMFSPYKQAPSPVIFGTLPSRASASAPGSWETLLFCPNPAGGRANHRGWKAPRDHYFLDLFYMPVVEPYAITDNFATAGKVNLNYQIAPFSYITRKTSMYALLDCLTASGLTTNTTVPGGTASYAKGTILAVPESKAALTSFRSPNLKWNGAGSESMRVLVDTKATLDAFDTRFAANDPFVSASEITEMMLTPTAAALSAAQVSTVEDFWSKMTLTGDDKLEAPYNSLYPRVTTRSNTFRVHFWVQTLNPKTKPAVPIVTGEYRGSTVIERYLDPNVKDYGTPIPANTALMDVDATFPAMNDRYRFRQVEHHQFAP